MTIAIYMKPAGCFGCNRTKELFAAKGVPFVEVCITTNEAALEYITEELQYARSRWLCTSSTTVSITGQG